MLTELTNDVASLARRVDAGTSVFTHRDLVLIFSLAPVVTFFLATYLIGGSAWAGWGAALSGGLVSLYIFVICPLKWSRRTPGQPVTP